MISGYGSLTKPLPGAQINPAHPLSRGLVGCWLFNEGAGSVAHDISGHGNHGTLTNMSTNAQNSGWGGNKFGGGLNFDGSDDYVDPLGGQLIGTNNTLSAWIKLNTSSQRSRIVGEFSPSFWRNYGQGILYDEGNIVVMSNAGDDKNDLITPLTDTTSWHHVVGIVRSLNGKLFLDGNEMDSGDLTSGWDYHFSIGNSIGNAGNENGNNFNGSMVDVRRYDRALSPAEAKQLHEDPFCNILSPRRWYVPGVPPVGAIMNQFQKCNVGADLFNGSLQ